MKKIGLLCLALVLALGSLGIGYASWTDTITIDGTVNTGDVDINIVEYSSTYVFKNTITGELIIRSVPLRLGTHEVLIASAVAKPGNGDDEVTITYTNLFPSIDFVADVLLHYEGSIPVKVNVATVTTSDQWMLNLYTQRLSGADADAPESGIWVEGWESNAAGEKLSFIGYGPGLQLHECDYILVEFHIHLPQDNTLMDLSGSFTADLEVIQWNEYNNQEPNG